MVRFLSHHYYNEIKSKQELTEGTAMKVTCRQGIGE